MSKKKTTIHEHQSAVDELDFAIEHQIEELGRLLLEKKLADIDQLRDPYEKGMSMKTEMESMEKQREHIRRDVEKQQALKEQIGELESEDKLYMEGRRKLIGSLGAHAYRVYRSGVLDKEAFEDIFSEIDRIEADIILKRRDIEEHNARQTNKNILQKIPAGAKTAVLKAGIGRLEKQRDDYLPVIGRKLLESDKVEHIPDEQVQSVTSNLKQQEEKSNERNNKKEKLQSEFIKLQQEVEKLCESVSPDRKVKELDDRISEQQDKFFQQSRELGQAYLLQPSLELKLPKELQDVLKRIDELKEQKQAHEDSVHTLQAELEIEELEENIRKKEEQVSRLEKRIREEKAQIEALREDLSRDNGRIQELRKIVNKES
ncbi:MAG: hypothetical protein ACP5IA_12655 [Sediminispirochaetaceae bacterium]